jgi:signal transduction histidine kinase
VSGPGDLESRSDRTFLVRRLYLTLIVLAVGSLLSALADAAYGRGHLAGLWWVRGAELGLVAAGFLLARRCTTWNAVVALALVVVCASLACNAALGAISGDTYAVLMTYGGIALLCAAVLPWGIAPQTSVAAVAAALIIVSAGENPQSLAYARTISLIGVGLSIFIAYELQHNRSDAVWSERQVRELNRDLAERTERLEAANRELEAFSYSVSHDLRAPLRVVEGFGRTLTKEFTDELPADARHYVERMLGAVERMDQIISDLLLLSHVMRSDLDRVPIDLAAMATAAAAELRATDPGRSVTFVAPEHLPASADPRLLRIVIENLLGNAWKFTRKNPTARIELGVDEPAGGERVFWVRDDGVGFEMERAADLFAPFQRFHPRSEFEGTGIGLSIVQRIVHRHGGRIWAESRPQEGATFYFTLGPPARDKATPHSSHDAA